MNGAEATTPAAASAVQAAAVAGPAADTAQAAERAVELQVLQETQREVRDLARRDREVRAHEQAHASVGGRYASAPRYEFQRGPNGVSYAVSGSVDIDVSPVPGDPAATLAKMETVRRAALAVAQPSAADRAVATQASAMAAEARAELARSNASGQDSAAAGSLRISGRERPEEAGNGDTAAAAPGDLAPIARFGDTGGAFVDIRV